MGVRGLVAVSGLCMLVQVPATDYASRDEAPLLFWIGAFLLLLVWRRRSRWARSLVVISSWVGVLIYVLGALGSLHYLLLTGLFAGQALPLMTRAVREHVDPAPSRSSSRDVGAPGPARA